MHAFTDPGEGPENLAKILRSPRLGIFFVPRLRCLARTQQGSALLLYADVYPDKADILFTVVAKVQ